MDTIDVIFFDLGDTLGTAVLSAARDLVRFDVFPYVPAVLNLCRDHGARLGIISNTGDNDGNTVDTVLLQAGLRDNFDGLLRIYSKDVGLSKNSPAIFQLASAKAGHGADPARCLFVGEDARERGFAMDAGMRACPHPLLIRAIFDQTLYATSK
jgi:FMN phosphatase YigB (HAD superfamily)